MPRIDAGEWRPRGVESLEPAADQVVRSASNGLVIAGPGAGKTELLAQRACFLLETGACPAPRRILAISFKRDAAKNLAERVEKRCGELTGRFDSLTLDAFGKSVIDRFRAALPPAWRPDANYEVMIRTPSRRDMREWFLSVKPPPNMQQPNFRGMNDQQICESYELCQFGYRIPFDQVSLPLRKHYALAFWRNVLSKSPGTPSLTFPMLNRLAAFLLRNNPKLLTTLRLTYSHVFMDEFQDTTDSQYDLVETAFRESRTIVTAVGDSKQRIMTWAGAMEDAFDRFTNDFAAEKTWLVRNYRSTPELVRVQHFIAQAIESESLPAETARSSDAASTCTILEFSNPDNEASYLARMIVNGLNSDGLKPRDFCVLARQRTTAIIQPLQNVLAFQGVRLRDESALQDMLAEPFTSLTLSLLRLATRKRDPEAWEYLQGELSRLYDTGSLEFGTTATKEAERLLNWTKAALSSSTISPTELPKLLLQQIGVGVVCGYYRQYRVGTYLDELASRLGEAMFPLRETPYPTAVNDFIGEDAVPAMTVHKSKGLEFHTVVFMGLEDSQLWNFANQSDEEIRGFFVAFSRAIHRVLFTFSDVRHGKFGLEVQGTNSIKDLYALLHSAGVQTIDCR